MFSKKNKETARKIKIDHAEMPAQEIKINIRPLVTIERHQLNVNGQDQKPTFRISIADRDVITLSHREYQELFMEMLRHKDNDELIHDISEVHAEEHAHAGQEIAGLMEFLGKNMPPELAEILKGAK